MMHSLWTRDYVLQDGKPSSELWTIKAAMRHLKRLYGDTPAGVSPCKPAQRVRMFAYGRAGQILARAGVNLLWPQRYCVSYRGCGTAGLSSRGEDS
ncbi:MAG: hypothetical protein NTY65_04800 [Planctomycetota bacterium]|nr:hypothetical protein [Planctomycetota bacterium]